MSDVTVIVNEITTEVSEDTIAVSITPLTHTVTVSPGTTDHGLLTGLSDDDHPQYLTQERADARYTRTVGGTGDSTYRHVQLMPSSVWVITHSLGKYPSVTVTDSTKRQVYGDVQFDSMDQVTVSFGGSAFSGEAFIN